MSEEELREREAVLEREERDVSRKRVESSAKITEDHSWMGWLGLNEPEVEQTAEQQMRPLKFLFMAYEPEYWYWEV